MGRSRLKELAGPLQMFGEQSRITHDTLDVSESFLIPVGDAGSRDEFPEILISRAPELHPLTVRTFKAAAPDTARCTNDMGRIMDLHGTGTNGWKRGIEQGHLNVLPDTVAAACNQGHDDAHDALEGGIVGRDSDGGIHRTVGLGIMWSISGRCGPDDAFESAHLRPRII